MLPPHVISCVGVEDPVHVLSALLVTKLDEELGLIEVNLYQRRWHWFDIDIDTRD
jgi:hypothetical protein